MFGRRYSSHPSARGRRSGNNLGLFLLAFQVMQFGIENIPLVTLITLCLNCAIFLHFPPDYTLPLHDACISFTNVWYLREWQRLFLAPWYHGSDIHLYYNMSSLIWKGRKLENQFGPIRFAVTLLTFCMVSAILTVALSFAVSEIMDDVSYLSQCAVGFSGVLFAFKVLLSYYESHNSFTRVLFLTVPVRMAFWVELVLIQILVPNVSFVGHLAGILTGLLFVKGPLKSFVKECSGVIESAYGSFIGFGRGSHSSGHSTNQGAYYTGSRTPWNTFSGSMSERDQMEWAMRDSSSMNRRSSSRPSTNIYDRPPASHRTASTDGIYPHLDDAQTYANHFYHEASAPAEDDSMTFTTQTSRTVHSDPTSSSHNYPDIGFIRQQRVNRYT